MYKCRECKEYFDEPDYFVEKYEAYGSPWYEKFYVCPYCGDSNYDESWIVEGEEEEEEKEREEDVEEEDEWLEEQNTNPVE